MTRSFTAQYRDEYTELEGGSRLAIMTIDSQNDWVAPGALYRIEPAAAVLPELGRLCDAVRDSASWLTHVLRLYLADGSNADRCRIEDLSSGKASCIPGSDGAELVPEIMRDSTVRLDADVLLAGEFQELGERELAVYKPRFGAFSSPRLAEGLRAAGITSLLIAGVSFPRCVLASVFGALDNDFRVGLVTDATSEVEPGELAFLMGAGVQAFTVDQAIEFMESGAQPALEPLAATA